MYKRQGVFYARYILGKWTKAEGLVYPFFDAKKHMIDDDLSSGRYYISCDYGTLNPVSYTHLDVYKRQI